VEDAIVRRNFASSTLKNCYYNSAASNTLNQRRLLNRKASRKGNYLHAERIFRSQLRNSESLTSADQKLRIPNFDHKVIYRVSLRVPLKRIEQPLTPTGTHDASH